MFRKTLLALGALTLFMLSASVSRADGLLVAQCVEFTTCWTSGTVTPWSDTLTATDLANVEAAAGSTTIPFIVEENTESVIRLGVTKIVFSTSGGPVTQTLGEFNGIGTFSDPCPTALPYCETDVVGDFRVPTGATGATISGTFGNSTVPNSAGECLYLGATGPCSLSGTSPVPEPTSIVISAIGLLALLAFRLWRKQHA